MGARVLLSDFVRPLVPSKCRLSLSFCRLLELGSRYCGGVFVERLSVSVTGHGMDLTVDDVRLAVVIVDNVVFGSNWAMAELPE